MQTTTKIVISILIIMLIFVAGLISYMIVGGLMYGIGLRGASFAEAAFLFVLSYVGWGLVAVKWIKKVWRNPNKSQ